MNRQVAEDSGFRELLVELADVVAEAALTRTERKIVSGAITGEDVPEVERSDPILLHIVRKRLDASGNPSWPPSHLEVGYLDSGAQELQHARVELLDATDVSHLAQAFRWLLDQEQAEEPSGDA